jgi:hypothetical protein
MFDKVLPKGVQDNGTGWVVKGITIHLKGMEVIKLFLLSSSPERPGIKLLELVACEGAKNLFFQSDVGLHGQ